MFLQGAGAHGRRLQGSSKQFFYFYFQIFVLPTKISSFIFERVLDHAYKVYEGKESQTLNFECCLMV